MKFFIFAVLSLLVANCQAQTASDTTNKQRVHQDTTFYPQEQLEITAVYPGGPRAWKSFLDKNIKQRYISDDPNNKIKVTVQFTVDMHGHINEVQAIDGPNDGGFKEEAVRVVKKSRLWLPAVKGGRQVNSYRKIVVEFFGN